LKLIDRKYYPNVLTRKADCRQIKELFEGMIALEMEQEKRCSKRK